MWSCSAYHTSILGNNIRPVAASGQERRKQQTGAAWFTGVSHLKDPWKCFSWTTDSSVSITPVVVSVLSSHTAIVLSWNVLAPNWWMFFADWWWEICAASYLEFEEHENRFGTPTWGNWNESWVVYSVRSTRRVQDDAACLQFKFLLQIENE